MFFKGKFSSWSTKFSPPGAKIRISPPATHHRAQVWLGSWAGSARLVVRSQKLDSTRNEKSRLVPSLHVTSKAQTGSKVDLQFCVLFNCLFLFRLLMLVMGTNPDSIRFDSTPGLFWPIRFESI